MIRKKIVAKVNEAKNFLILADKSTDISSIEQVSICIRYILGSEIQCLRGFSWISLSDGRFWENDVDIDVDCSFMYTDPSQVLLLEIYVHCTAHSFSLDFFHWLNRQSILKNKNIEYYEKKSVQCREKLKFVLYEMGSVL